MSHRLEVMLTSRRPDGSWTWRAAGARQPKGVLEESLAPAGASVGDVLRVEADVGVDGISVRQVLPAKAERPPPSRVEHLGSGRFTEGVTGPAKHTRQRAEPTGGPGGRQRRDGDGGRAREGGRSQRTQGPQRDGSGRRGGREKPQRAPRLRPAGTHRDAWLETLSPAERPLAERLVNEGIRAVRQALQAESPQSDGQEAGRSADAVDARLAVVEGLFAAFRAADWRDRAEAARKVSDEVDLRDLRSVVAGIPQQLPDDEARSLAEELRGKLAARVDREHSAWIADLGSLLRKERLVTALRVSQRPPKAGTPLPESLAQSLERGARSHLNAGAEDDLWVRILEAAAQSPIRLVQVAQEQPPEPSERLLRTVRRFGERLPALRAQFAEHLEAPAPTDETAEPAEVEESDEAAEAPAAPMQSDEAAEPAEVEESDEASGDAEAAEAPVQTEEIEEPAADEEPAEASEASGESVQDADVDQEVAESGGEVEVA